jgi:DNA-binding MarR family transcriptional regulator
MDLKGSKGDIVRLKFFLARQSEGRHSRRGGASAGSAILTGQEAAALACLAWMEDYAGRQMKGREIAGLLRVTEQRLSTLMGVLLEKGLVSASEVYYQVTEEGMQQLGAFADWVLGLPEKVEAKLEKETIFIDLMTLSEQMINDDLRNKFNAAKEDG